jgi:hypothetical protein
VNSDTTRQLTLESLVTGIPVIPEESAGFYRQNCMVCFDNQGHKSGVGLRFLYEDEGIDEAVEIHWSGDVTAQMRRAFGDLISATELAACAIALLLVREFTEFTAAERAKVGTAVDYYLLPQGSNDALIFNYTARLEVSGILKENSDTGNTVNRRIREKLERLAQFDLQNPEDKLPTFIIVVEFSNPLSRMVKT